MPLLFVIDAAFMVLTITRLEVNSRNTKRGRRKGIKRREIEDIIEVLNLPARSFYQRYFLGNQSFFVLTNL